MIFFNVGELNIFMAGCCNIREQILIQYHYQNKNDPEAVLIQGVKIMKELI